MEDKALVKSSFSATINAHIEEVDIPPGAIHCRAAIPILLPVQCSGDATTAPDGPRMSIDVERLGGSL